MSIYYVYAYLRSSNLTPYYIGKGKGDRAYSDHGWLHIPPNKDNIVFFEKNLTELGAFALERRYIRWYGREDNGTGILKNKTDGGEGASGTIISEESRKKMSISHSGANNYNFGQSMPQEQKDKISISKKGTAPWNKDKENIYSEEALKQMSLARLGKPLSEETKGRMSKSRLGEKNPMFGKSRPDLAENNRKRSKRNTSDV